MGSATSKGHKKLSRSESQKCLIQDDIIAAYPIKPSVDSSYEKKENGIYPLLPDNNVPQGSNKELNGLLEGIKPLLADLQQAVVDAVVNQNEVSSVATLACQYCDRGPANAMYAEPVDPCCTVLPATSTPTASNSVNGQHKSTRSTPLLFHPTSISTPNTASANYLKCRKPNIPELKCCYVCSNEYRFVTSARTGEMIYTRNTSSKNQLFVKGMHHKSDINISGITAIAQGFNFVFVLRKSGEKIHCIRYSMTLQDERKLFVKSSQDMSSSSLTVGDNQLLTVIGYLNGEEILESYNFSGARVNIIDLPSHMHTPQHVVSMSANRFVIHSSSTKAVAVVQVEGRRAIEKWRMSRYEVDCITTDEVDTIYAVTKIFFNAKHLICVINMDPQGNLLAVKLVPELEADKVEAVTTINVQNKVMVLQCGSRGTYVYKLK